MIDTDETIAEHLEQIKAIHQSSREHLPTEFYKRIAKPWFEGVGPAKTQEYGVSCWKTLGAKGIAGQLNGCFYRWERLLADDRRFDDLSMNNAIMDTFGYTVLLHMVFDLEVLNINTELVVPKYDFGEIMSTLWLDHVAKVYPASVSMVAFRMTYNMYRAVQ